MVNMDTFAQSNSRYHKEAKKAGVIFSKAGVALGSLTQKERIANYQGENGELRALGAQRHLKMIQRRKNRSS